MNPSNFFNPGMGVPLAVLTKKAVFLTLEKKLMDEQFNVSITSMLDVAEYIDVSGLAGSLVELKVGYIFEQDLHGLLALTNVTGTSNHPDGENYAFNRMEDFSHIRFELKYFF